MVLGPDQSRNPGGLARPEAPETSETEDLKDLQAEIDKTGAQFSTILSSVLDSLSGRYENLVPRQVIAVALVNKAEEVSEAFLDANIEPVTRETIEDIVEGRLTLPASQVMLTASVDNDGTSSGPGG